MVGAARRIWNAADHPRGPNGRFIKGGGSNSKVHAPHPTSPSGSTAAARGARPGSAAAMFAAGAGKGRIHASTSRPKVSAPKKPSAPVAARHADATKADIRSAVAELQREPGGWVGLADLREKLGGGASRKEVDAALHGMLDEPGVRIIPVANSKGLKPRDRAAAVSIGGEDNHVIAIDRRASAAKPTAPRPTPDRIASTHAERVAAYERMDEPRLNQFAANAGINTAGMSKQEKAEALARHDAGGGRKQIVDVNRPVVESVTRAPGGSLDRFEFAKGGRTGAGRSTAAKVLDTARVADIASRLKAAGSRDEARKHLSGLTAPQLRQLATHLGATVGAKNTKPQLVERLADIPGRRLDSEAIKRMTRR